MSFFFLIWPHISDVKAAGENIDPKGSSKVVGTIDQFEEFIAKYEKVTEINGDFRRTVENGPGQ